MDTKTMTLGIVIGVLLGGIIGVALFPSEPVSDYQHQINQLTTSVSNLQGQIDDLETDFINVQNENRQLESAITQYHSTLESRESSIETLNDEIDVISYENDALRQQITDILGPDVDVSPISFDKMDLWDMETGPHLRGAVIHLRRRYNDLDGYVFLGSGSTGPPYTQEDITRLASLGANFALISHAGIFSEEAPYVLDKEMQRSLDNIIEMIEEADMFAVIAFTSGPGRSVTNYWGTGDEDFPWHLHNNDVWEQQEAQDAWVDMWRYTAERYKDNPIIVGYQLLHEPNSNAAARDRDSLLVDREYWDPEEFYEAYGGSLVDWNQLYPRIVESVREVDKNTPVLIGGNAFSSVRWLPFVDPVEDSKAVYLFHQYEPMRYTHTWPLDTEGNFDVEYPGVFDVDWDGRDDVFDKSWLDNYFSTIDDYVDSYDVSVASTEFGCTRWSPGVEVFMDDEMGLFEERGINSALWMWYPDWKPYAWNDENNFLHGIDPPFEPRDMQQEEFPNALSDVIIKYWDKNIIRPSKIGK
jgi:outer membrane murein-binding lipoprotein Lpp